MITRRWFMIGTAASVAVAALPLAMAEGDVVSRGVLSSKLPFRRIHEIALSFDVPPSARDMGVMVDLSLRRSPSMVRVPMNVRGLFFWRAMPGGEIVILDNDGFSLRCDPDPGCDGNVFMISNAERDRSKPSRRYSEHFTLSKGITRASDPLPIDIGYELADGTP